MSTSNGLRTTQDQAILRRAIRGRWPIPDHLRARAVEVCQHVLDTDETTVDEKLSAIKSLTVMDAINVKEEISDKPKLHVHQMSDSDIEERLSQIEQQTLFMNLTKLLPEELS